MTDVFISYSQKDRTVARWLAESLERDGCDVWWDTQLVAGQEFRPEVQDNIDAARCVVVIWSKASAESAWVRAEANAGLNPNRLVPVSIGDVRLPPPFGEFQTVDLTDWRGDLAHPGYQSVLKAVRGFLASESQEGKREPGEDDPLPIADQRRFNIVVAKIEQDIGDQLQDLVATDLAAYEGIYVVKLSRVISISGPVPEKSLAVAEEVARTYLDEMDAAVMIWGKIVRFAGQAVPELHLTVSRGRSRPPGRYLPNHELRLPRVFWSNLSDILCMIVLTYDAEFRALEGSFLGDRLQPFVARVQRLLTGAAEQRGWSDEARGLARIVLGDALMLIGSQGGDRRKLEEAIATFENALKELPRNDAPRDWARANNGLGIACWILGDWDGNSSLLERAVAACNAAIEVRSPEREPIEWAQAYNDLGNALVTIGKRATGTAQLERAVAAYQKALSKRTVEASQLDWAQTKNNLGVALWHLGQRAGSAELLEEAVSALTASLDVYKKGTTPLDWSQTKNNLGLVLWALGERSGETKYYLEAINMYREALRERRRLQVPLLWAQTQNNLGLALWSLGESTDDIKRLRQASRAFHRALTERTRERTATDWAETQNNFGAVLWSLGQHATGTKELEQAVQAYNDALSVYSERTGTVMEVARTRRNLGNALAALGKRRSNLSQLEDALEHLRASLSVHDPEREPIQWAEIQGDIGFAALEIGEHSHDSNYLDQAKCAFGEAASAYHKAKMNRHALAFSEQAGVTQNLLDHVKE